MAVREAQSLAPSTPIVLMAAQGHRLTQQAVEGLARHQNLLLICGRYEGVDERVRRHLATDEISVGDYVLSGGELAAMVVIDAVSRLMSGVVGTIESTQDDSFTTGLLQHPTKRCALHGYGGRNQERQNQYHKAYPGKSPDHFPAPFGPKSYRSLAILRNNG